jgi:hypothetical protein
MLWLDSLSHNSFSYSEKKGIAWVTKKRGARTNKGHIYNPSNSSTGYIELALVMDDHRLSFLAHHNPSLSTEIIHSPKRVQGQEERERGYGDDDVEYHPSDHVPFALHDEDEGLYTIDRGYHY